MKVFNIIESPEHYCSGDIECIDAMVAAFGEKAVQDFCICNAFKYLWRFRMKNGTDDLRKCRWYIDKYIAIEENSKNDGNGA